MLSHVFLTWDLCRGRGWGCTGSLCWTPPPPTWFFSINLAVLMFHLFSMAFSFSATFGWDFPKSFRNSVSNSLLATWIHIVEQVRIMSLDIKETSSKKYLPQLLTQASSKVIAWTTTCGSGWLRRLTKALKHSLGPVLVAPTLRKQFHMFSRKLYKVSPVTDGHDEPPVLGGVLLISHLLHQSVKLCLGVPEDPHLDGFYGFSDARTPLRGFSWAPLFLSSETSNP